MTTEWMRPALYDWLLAGSEARGLAQRRRRLLAGAKGRVLELGAGSGLNLRWYRAGKVDSVVALEPDPAMRQRLGLRVSTAPVAVEVVAAAAESAAFGEASFDTVVSTLTLCSV